MSLVEMLIDNCSLITYIMFPEKLLHFIWQTRRFDMQNLHDSEGNIIRIIHVGTLNSNQGPDFLNAKIQS